MLYFAREDIEVVPQLSLEFLRACGFGYGGRRKPDLTDEQVLAKIGTEQPIYPRKFTLSKLHRLSVIDPILYYAQYKNNPISDGTKDFDTEKLRYFDFDDQGNVVYRDEKGRLQTWERDQLDIVMTCDPNSGDMMAPDLPAISVSATSPKDQTFVFESWSRRCPPDEFVDTIFSMWSRWSPRVLGIEKAGQQTTAFYFKKKTKDLGVYINVQALEPHNRKKTEKIRKAIQPIINTRRLFIRKSQGTLKTQLQFHPDLENDDELEALAYGADLWRSPLSAREREEEDDAVTTVLKRRSSLTGYGA